MLDGMAHNFTTFLKNSWVVNSVERILVVGTDVAYFENRSMMTKMTSCSPTFGRCVMKSSDILFQGLVGTDKGSRSLETLAFSTLSCWQMMHVFVYCIMSIPHIWPKVPLFH